MGVARAPTIRGIGATRFEFWESARSRLYGMDQEQEQTSQSPSDSPADREVEPGEGSIARAHRWIGSFPYARRTLWIGGTVVALILLVFALQYLNSGQPKRGGGGFGGSGGGPTPVGIAKVGQGAMPISLNALGTVTPLATVTVRPQVSGQLLKFDFTEGQTVKAGDVLAEIDPSTFKAALDQAKGALARDRASLANAIVDVKRYRDLWAAKAISQQQVATQEALVKQDEGVVAADEGNVKVAQINLDYCRIVSPVAGRAGIRQLDVGNLVQAGQSTGIVVVTQVQPMSVLFSIPEDNIDRILARMNGGAQLAVAAFDRTQARQIASGTLTAVDSTIDTTTGTVKLRAIFDNKDNALFPNQFVNVHLLIDTLQNQTLVPVPAIQRGTQGTFVYVVNADKTVNMRTIKTGTTDGTNTVVTGGLRAGDTIVVDGADRLKDGAQITLPNAPTGAIAPPSAAPTSEDASATHRGDRFQKLLSRLPPDQQEMLKKMTPEQRRAWIQQHRDLFPRRNGQ
jgi:multidrug efflux system membrane fusion protein